MTDPKPMTYAESATALRDSSQRIRAVEETYKRAIEDASVAEALYRRTLGEKFGEYREKGMAVEAAMTQARADCWNLSRERDLANGTVRYELERLEDRRGDRASLHKLVEWSAAVVVLEGRSPNGDGTE